MPDFNVRIKQMLTLLILLGLIFLAGKELVPFLPGLLGAVTLYIISRRLYFTMVFQKKWSKAWVAIGYIFFYLIIFLIPFTVAVTLISPKINKALQNPEAIIETGKHVITTIQNKIGLRLLSENALSDMVKRATAAIPKLLNSTINIISNLAIMLFILYYMLVRGSEIERYLSNVIPLKRNNIHLLSVETKKLVISNALGVPFISIIQGLVATLGYFLFGVKDWGLYGFITGVCAFFPVVGTMIVWVPLVLYMYASGDVMNAVLLGIYSIIATGNIDYVARVTLLKKMANVHPVITILGVLVGLGLFGFIGLIFGPLLINYIIVLYDIYMNEFVYNEPAPLSPEEELLSTKMEKKK
ncbi:AI-2E family transporter [Niabella aurantiaca]|uniref:AI-2E family transporter n=1 Tax=Niabella aurantiaca TaxID=379900 RepID=UPI000367F714|nr:AI-2E family transporter [Niabella aurantiaca]